MSAYTDKQVEVMINEYGKGNTDVERKAIVDRLAVEMGKTSRSVIAKLVSVGHYIKKTSTKSNSGTAMKKDEYVNAIRIALGARDNELKSLGNATKVDLEVIMNQLRVINNKQELKALEG